MKIFNLKNEAKSLVLTFSMICFFIFGLYFNHNSISVHQFWNNNSSNQNCIEDSILINQLIDYKYYNNLDSTKLLDQNYYFKLLSEINNNIFYKDEYIKEEYNFKVIESKIHNIGKCHIAYYEFKNFIGCRQNRVYIIVNYKLKYLYIMYLDNLEINENCLKLILLNRNNSVITTKVVFESEKNRFVPLSCYK